LVFIIFFSLVVASDKIKSALYFFCLDFLSRLFLYKKRAGVKPAQKQWKAKIRKEPHSNYIA
jgi:hypothetical protein